MYWIIFVTLSISHCIGVKSLPVTTRDPGYVAELLDKIKFLNESNIICEPQTLLYTTSSSGIISDSLDCIKKELDTMEAECVNSTSPLNNKTEDERQVIRNELELTKMLMDKMYRDPKRDCDDCRHCDEEKPWQDFLKELKLLVQKEFSE